MREVEPQLVGPDGGAGLRDMVAEDLAERRLQEVRRGVVRHRREPHAPRHDGTDPIAGANPSPRKSSTWSSSNRYASTSSARPPVVVALDPALVRHLAAATGIERRLAQLREERRPSCSKAPSWVSTSIFV